MLSWTKKQLGMTVLVKLSHSSFGINFFKAPDFSRNPIFENPLEFSKTNSLHGFL